MAFDVFVGTFTRFYTRQWENVVQRQAKAEGHHYQMIYADGDNEPPTAEEVLEGVSGWQRAINEGLAVHGLGPIEWSEDEKQPYFTDRPGWEGFSALLLWAAYAQSTEQPAPPYLPEIWLEDPVYQSVMDREKPEFPAILMANIWLPGDFEFRFEFPPLAGDDNVMIASTKSLLDNLHRLATTEPNWSKNFIPEQEKQIPFEEAAREGMDVFAALAQHAVDNSLPLILSF
ncbi:MAG: hypothetical protein LBE62_07520 [Azonexus sp.]|jgi:hypothetical protein|nr:hypothetical protein [Azonexus sp.]